MPETTWKLINDVHINGRIATEPEQKGGGPLKFRLAHGGGGKRKDGTPWPTQFFTVCWWDPRFPLEKGNRIEVFGRLKDASYEAKDGTKRSAVEITATMITMPDEAAPKENSPPKSKPAEPNIHGVAIEDHEIPF